MATIYNFSMNTCPAISGKLLEEGKQLNKQLSIFLAKKNHDLRWT